MGLSVLSSFREQNTWLWLSLSSVSKHNMWLYYGWVCRCCRPSENRIHGCGCRCRLSVNTTCGCIMDGFVGVVVLQRTEYMVVVVVVVSVNTTCGCIMDGFVGVVVLQRAEYMVGVVVVVCQ